MLPVPINWIPTRQLASFLGIYCIATEGMKSHKAVNLSISLEQPDKKLALFGSADRYLRMIREALGVPTADGTPALLRTSARHLGAGGVTGNTVLAPLVYRTVTQASIDNNTVDVNVERAQFADNAMRYEASLTFINSKLKSLLAAVQG